MPLNSYDKYLNERSHLIDTAETPKDKKNLKADLAKLDDAYKAAKLAQAAKKAALITRNTAGVKTTTPTVNKTFRPMGK